MNFFSIAASAVYIAAGNPNAIKALLTKIVSTHFMNSKPTVINDLRKIKRPPFQQLIFWIVTFNKIPLFSQDLITIIISLLFHFSVKVETLIDHNSWNFNRS